MAKLTPLPARSPAPPPVRFRGEIEAAIADGFAAQDMTLRLTLRDANILARDRDIPVADISYLGGVMRYLGVRIEKGGIPASVLDRGES